MKILRIRGVCERTGISRTRVYQLEGEKRFPSRIRLGPNTVGWLEHEIDEWILEKVRSTRGENRAQAVAPQG